MGITSTRRPATSPTGRIGTGSKPSRDVVPTRSWAEHYAAGKALRETFPREAHAAWKPPSNRRDAVDLVLEPFAGKSVFPNHGQRVVDGYRRMQPASDIFPGWSRGPKRDFFIRQLRDMEIGPMVETFGQAEMDIYAGWCGKALALSHARSGNSAMISGDMGKSDVFDTAIAACSTAYADQNERDHGALDRAIRKGKVKAILEDAR